MGHISRLYFSHRISDLSPKPPLRGLDKIFPKRENRDFDAILKL
jgi:hypothetical protein